MAKPKLPGQTTLRIWYENEDMTIRQMVEANAALGNGTVTENAFTMAWRRLGWEPRNRFYYDLLPWAVNPVHEGHVFQRQLRRLSRRNAGNLTSENEIGLLESWLRDMDEPQPQAKPPAPYGLVVQYEWDSEEGFYAVPRRKTEIGKYIRKPRRDQPLRKRSQRQVAS